MPRSLQYICGIRLAVDPFDHTLWHFALRGTRYALRERGGTVIVETDAGTSLGRFVDGEQAMTYAFAIAGIAPTGRIPLPLRDGKPGSQRVASSR